MATALTPRRFLRAMCEAAKGITSGCGPMNPDESTCPDCCSVVEESARLDPAQGWCDPDLPGKPTPILRGLVCRCLQAFSRGFDLRLGRPVAARPDFRR